MLLIEAIKNYCRQVHEVLGVDQYELLMQSSPQISLHVLYAQSVCALQIPLHIYALADLSKIGNRFSPLSSLKVLGQSTNPFGVPLTTLTTFCDKSNADTVSSVLLRRQWTCGNQIGYTKRQPKKILLF
jgi:hypothetical protein